MILTNRLITAYLALLLLHASQASAREFWEGRWIEVQTPSFRILSNLDADDTLELATGLEGFRRVTAIITNLGNVEPRVPTVIHLLKRPDDTFGLSSTRNGWFRSEMRGNYVAMHGRPRGDPLWILQHEYVHFLMHNRDTLEFPPWFAEGFAELLATAHVDGNEFEFGEYSKNRRDWLVYGDWRPYNWVVNVRNTGELHARQAAMFYAQSWALVHYLSYGREGADFGEQGTRYFALLAQGGDRLAAFEQAFDVKARDLVRLVRRYLGRQIRSYRVTMTQPFPATQAQTRTPSPDEVAATFGHLALISGKLDQAREFHSAALEINPDNADALVGMADLYKFEGRFAEAEPLYQHAIALQPASATHLLDYAEYFITRGEQADNVVDREQFLEAARTHLRRSQDLDPTLPETRAMFGYSYLLEDKYASALDKLVVANQLLPSYPGIKLMLADAYKGLGFRDDAVRMAKMVLGWSHEGASESAAEFLRGIGATAELDNPDADDQ